jgi:hypothetical protein
MTQTIEIRLEANQRIRVEVQADESDIAQFPRDLPLAWQEADEVGAAAESLEERGHAIGQQCRCALIVTSIASTADTFSPDLIVASVQQSRWPLEQALLWIQHKTERKEREDSLLQLAPAIPSELWPQVLTVMQPLGLDTLTSLFPALPMTEQQVVKQQVFDALREAHYMCRDRFLSNVVAFFSLDELRHTLAIADGVQPASYTVYKEQRADMLMVLLPRLAELGFRDEAESLVQTISDPWRRAATLTDMARFLPAADRAGLLFEVCQMTSDFQWNRAAVLTEVALQFADMGNIVEARGTAEQITEVGYRLIALAKLLEYFPEDDAQEVLALIRNRTERGTVDQRRDLCCYVGPELAKRGDIEGVFPYIDALAWDDVIPVLRELVPRLVTLGYTEQLLEFVTSRRSSERMAVLARYLPSPHNSTALRQAMSWKNPIWDQTLQLPTLTRLAAQLPDGEAKRQIAIAAIRVAQQYIRTRTGEGIEYDIFTDDLYETLTALSSVLPEAIKQEILDEWITTVRQHAESWWPRSIPFLVGETIQFTPHMTEQLRQQIVPEMLALIEGIDDEDERADAVGYAIAPYLPESQWPPLPPEALEEARAQRQWYLHAPSENKDFPVASGEELEAALRQARRINSSGYGYRAEALKKLISSLLAAPPAERYRLWSETLHDLAKKRSRLDLLSDLSILAPIIASLGGHTGVIDVAEAIVDIAKWFV